MRIATDPSLFTYIGDCRADGSITLGDGRASLAARAGAEYSLIVLDAFSSDSIPVHLLTAEALGVYSRALADGGVIAVHISNRYLDLYPVLDATARSAGYRSSQTTTLSPRLKPTRAKHLRGLLIGHNEASLAPFAADRSGRRLPDRSVSARGPMTTEHLSVMRCPPGLFRPER